MNQKVAKTRNEDEIQAVRWLRRLSEQKKGFVTLEITHPDGTKSYEYFKSKEAAKAWIQRQKRAAEKKIEIQKSILDLNMLLAESKKKE